MNHWVSCYYLLAMELVAKDSYCLRLLRMRVGIVQDWVFVRDSFMMFIVYMRGFDLN